MKAPETSSGESPPYYTFSPPLLYHPTSDLISSFPAGECELDPFSNFLDTLIFFSRDLPILPPPTPPSTPDLLLLAAHYLDSGDLSSARNLLSRLNTPASGVASHFKDALLSLISPQPPVCFTDLIRRISAVQSLSLLSPIPHFTSFTTNQTLIESLTGAKFLHLIDFDFSLGVQWSSFAHDIASRSRAAGLPLPLLRITAVVAHESAETSLAASNLRDFAHSFGLCLAVQFARLGDVRLSAGEEVAAVLTPSLVGSPVLRFLQRAAPRVVVVVDTERFESGNSLRRRVAGGMLFYAAVMESVEAAGGGEEVVRRIERDVMRPRIFSSVAASASAERDWREEMAAAGMAVAELSEFTELQAEWLIRRAPPEGFHVERRDGEMVLSWKGKEVAATSAWRCC